MEVRNMDEQLKEFKETCTGMEIVSFITGLLLMATLALKDYYILIAVAIGIIGSWTIRRKAITLYLEKGTFYNLWR